MADDLETRRALADFALKAGQDPGWVSRVFQVGDAGNTSLGAQAQAKLDQLMRDSEWVRKFHDGDAVATDAFRALNLAIAYQHQEDAAAEIRATEANIEKTNAEQAAADKAAAENGGEQ